MSTGLCYLLSTIQLFFFLFLPVMWVRRRHNSIEVMKHILRDRGGLKAAETKHAGSRLAMQAGGWQSFNPHRSADKSACEFHFYPPYQFAWLLSDEQNPHSPLRPFDVKSNHGLRPLHWARLVLRCRANRWMVSESGSLSGRRTEGSHR